MISQNKTKIKNGWMRSKTHFSKNELKIMGFQVMQRWEDSYMRTLSSVATSKGGDILEVGFGLGIAASYIQKAKKIKSHTIIECHPDVIRYASKMFKNLIAEGKMTLICGFWEDVTPKLRNETFNGILFDTNPVRKETVFFHFFPFFKEAYRLLKRGGVFTYFSDESNGFSKKHLNQLQKAGFSKIDYKICKVNPMRSCRYWKQNTIVVPIITK